MPERYAVAMIERIFPSPKTILQPGVLDTGDSDLSGLGLRRTLSSDVTVLERCPDNLSQAGTSSPCLLKEATLSSPANSCRKVVGISPI